MKKTPDDIQYEDHNLWLVDDGLSFYEFVASDTPFSDNETAPVESLRRPDVLAFKSGDPYQHVALVEFKAPDASNDDPVRQLMQYAQLLRKGGARDANGVTLPGIPMSVRIDAYAIVTLSPRMEEKLQLAPVQRVEGEWRWYGSHPTLNMTIEVLDFRAFIQRAEQRNRAFFAKLNLT